MKYIAPAPGVYAAPACRIVRCLQHFLVYRRAAAVPRSGPGSSTSGRMHGRKSRRPSWALCLRTRICTLNLTSQISLVDCGFSQISSAQCSNPPHARWCETVNGYRENVGAREICWISRCCNGDREAAVPRVDRKRYVTKRDLVKYGYTYECQECSQLEAGMHNAKVPRRQMPRSHWRAHGGRR